MDGEGAARGHRQTGLAIDFPKHLHDAGQEIKSKNIRSLAEQATTTKKNTQD